MLAWAPEWGWTLACWAPNSSLARAGRGARAGRQDVGVVVRAGEPGGVGVGAGRRGDAGQLVGRDRHAEPGAADEDTPVGLARDDRPGHGGGVVGIVHGLGGLGAAVHDLVTPLDQPGLEVFFEGEARVVRTEGDRAHTATISVGGEACQATYMSGAIPLTAPARGVRCDPRRLRRGRRVTVPSRRRRGTCRASAYGCGWRATAP